MTLLDLLHVRRSIAKPARPLVPCPLCAGTDRARLEYDDDQLAEHASVAHDFEAVYEWTRSQYAGSPPLVLDMLDAAYEVVEALTTTYYEANDTGLYGWVCERCWTHGPAEHPGEDAARKARVDSGHRCPL